LNLLEFLLFFREKILEDFDDACLFFFCQECDVCLDECLVCLIDDYWVGLFELGHLSFELFVALLFPLKLFLQGLPLVIVVSQQLLVGNVFNSVDGRTESVKSLVGAADCPHFSPEQKVQIVYGCLVLQRSISQCSGKHSVKLIDQADLRIEPLLDTQSQTKAVKLRLDQLASNRLCLQLGNQRPAL